MTYVSRLWAWVSAFLHARRERKRQEATLAQYGWEGQCPACQGHLHGDNLVRAVRATNWHWHYRCQCGCVIHWFLGAMFPLLEKAHHPVQGFFYGSGRR